MIRGMHGMFYSSQAKELREFFRDKLLLRATIVHLTEGESAGVQSGTADISFYCERCGGNGPGLPAPVRQAAW